MQLEKRIKLEQQIKAFASIGLTFNSDVTLDDILKVYSRARYENNTFTDLLYTMGREKDRELGMPMVYLSDCAWHFDQECVHKAHGVYVELLNNLNRLAHPHSAVYNIEDHIDFERLTGWFQYQIDDQVRRWDVDVMRDSADTLTLADAMADFIVGDHAFYSFDDGCSTLVYFMTTAQNEALQALCPNKLVRRTSRFG